MPPKGGGELLALRPIISMKPKLDTRESTTGDQVAKGDRAISTPDVEQRDVPPSDAALIAALKDEGRLIICHVQD